MHRIRASGTKICKCGFTLQWIEVGTNHNLLAAIQQAGPYIGGVLKSKRHVNLPGIRVNLPAITEKDRRDILFGMEQEVDFIALSFVREAADVEQLRTLLGDKAGKIKIIAKIEDQEGVRNVADIAATADGIMVARGDLGIETNIADLPNIREGVCFPMSQQVADLMMRAPSTLSQRDGRGTAVGRRSPSRPGATRSG